MTLLIPSFLVTAEIYSMKKIIVALDGLKLSLSGIKTAIDLSKQENAHLVGVFLDDFTRNSFSMEDAIHQGNLKELSEKDQQQRDIAVKEFEFYCREAGINHAVHRDKSFALPDLMRESIYADLLVICADETFTRFTEAPPTRFIRDLLSGVQCPVLIAPLEYKPLKKVIMLYDGAPASVFAIKMFTGTLPETNQLPAEVITVKDEDLHLPENKLMKEFMKRHNPRAQYTVLNGEPEAAILHRLQKEGESTLVVLGAYQRGTVSRWFRSSMADTIQKHLKCPLFIAHN